MKFGEMMRAFRTEAGLRMRDVAEELRISVTYVSEIERGGRPPLQPLDVIRVGRVLELDHDAVVMLLGAAIAERGGFILELEGTQHLDAALIHVGVEFAMQWQQRIEQHDSTVREHLRSSGDSP